MTRSVLLVSQLVTLSVAICCAFAAVVDGAPTPQIYQGMHISDWEGSIFIPCENKNGWWWLDSKDRKTLQTLRKASEKSFAEQDRPLFIEFEGFTTSEKPNDDYEKTVWVTRLIHIQTLDYEKTQCREDQKPATPSK